MVQAPTLLKLLSRVTALQLVVSFGGVEALLYVGTALTEMTGRGKHLFEWCYFRNDQKRNHG
jgi:hypothetical protein